MEENSGGDKEVLKGVLRYLKIIRSSSGYMVFHEMVDGDKFIREVIEPLEQITDWQEEDERQMVELTEEIKKDVESGKTLKEKHEKLDKIINKFAKAGKIVAGVGVGTAAGLLAYRLITRKSREKE